MFEKDWDEETGMWFSDKQPHTKQICHLKQVHPAPVAACRLLLAAEAGLLRTVAVKRVLENLRSMVWTEDGQLYGCIKWYREEARPNDSNAAFFTGLPLIVLKALYSREMKADELVELDWILDKLFYWFVGSCKEHSEFYPNKYLGDLVCTWLIAEYLRKDEKEVAETANSMRRAAGYWMGAGSWGWGEHMGQYIGVLLDELSVLLILERKLPEDLRSDYLKMLNELLSIQDRFGEGPQVPTLRSYYFTESPRKVLSYRESIKPMDLTNPPEKMEPLKIFLAEHGWHKLVAPPEEKAPLPLTVKTPCFMGSSACAYIDKDIRLGGITRFPLMPWAEGASWGLSWQCFPVSLWRLGGDWGFLIWHATEGGLWRSHPMGTAMDPGVPRQLTGSITPPVIGRTESIMFGGEIFAARFMPVRPAAWTQFGDGFRIIRTTADAVIKKREGCWVQAMFSWPGRRVSVEFFNMSGGSIPRLRENDFGGYDLMVDYDVSQEGPALGVWRINLSADEDDAPPEVSSLSLPAQPRFSGQVGAFCLLWAGRKLIVDPLAPEIMWKCDSTD